MNYLRSIALIGTLLLMTARIASAQQYFFIDQDTTIDSLFGTGNTIVVGFSNEADLASRQHPVSVTVSVHAGGEVPQVISLQNGSTLNMDGGLLSSAIGAGNNSTVNISAGVVNSLVGGGSSTTNISGGTVLFGPDLIDHAAMVISGGDIGSLAPQGLSPDYHFNTHDSSTALLAGGLIHCNLYATDFSQITAKNTTILGAVETRINSFFSMTGGSVGGLSVKDFSLATVNGGSIAGELFSHTAKTVDVNGTSIGSVAVSAGTTTLNQATVAQGIGVQSANLAVHGGTIGGDATANGNSNTSLSLDGGVQVAGSVITGDSAAAVIFGATVNSNVQASQQSVIGMANSNINGGVATSDDSTFIMDSGSVVGDMRAAAASNIKINGGTVEGTILANGDPFFKSGVTITGGVIANVIASPGRVEMSGGTVQNDITAHRYAQVNLTGGNVAGSAEGFDTSKITVDGASVTNLIANDSSVYLNSGTVNGSVQVHGEGAAYITGGQVYGYLLANDLTYTQFDGGRVGNDVQLHYSAYFSMNGGTVAGSLTADGFSNAQFSGGTIATNVDLHTNAAFNLSGGTVGGDLNAHDLADVSMSGGVISGNATFNDQSGFFWSGGHVAGLVLMHDHSFLDWTGGTSGPGSASPAAALTSFAAVAQASVPTSIFLYDSSTLEVDGYTLSATLLDANNGGMFSEYQLFGVLADGTLLADGLLLFVQNGSGASFALVIAPEPSSVVLFGLGAIAFFALAARRQIR